MNSTIRSIIQSLMIASALPLYAQTLDSIQVCTDANSQYLPKVISNDDESIVVWADNRDTQVDTAYTLYTQLIRGNGAFGWQTNGIRLFDHYGALNQYAIVTDRKGGAFVSRSDMYWIGDSIQAYQISLQRIDREGTLKFGTQGITVSRDSTAPHWSYVPPLPSMCTDEQGSVFVAWHRWSSQTNGCDISVQKVDSNGNLLWRTDVDTEANGKVHPFVVSDGVGGVIVAYYSHSGSTNLKVQRISNGVRLWGLAGIIVDINADATYTPVLNMDACSDGSGGVYLSWIGYDQRRRAFVQHVDSTGLPIWNLGGIALTGGTIRSAYPKMAIDPDGNVVVACETWNGGDTSGVVVHKFSPSGQMLWGSNGVIADLGQNGFRFPGLSNTGNGGTFVSWVIQYGNSNEYLLRSRIIDANGTLAPSHSIAEIGPVYRNSVSLGDGRSLIVWDRSDDVFATVLDTNGVVTVSVSEQTVPGNAYLLKNNYPNPFNPTTTIEFSIPRSEFVTLKVFNTLGQEVRTLVNETTEAGEHRVVFDAGGLPSGVYVCRINAGTNTLSNKMLLVR